MKKLITVGLMGIAVGAWASAHLTMGNNAVATALSGDQISCTITNSVTGVTVLFNDTVPVGYKYSGQIGYQGSLSGN